MVSRREKVRQEKREERLARMDGEIAVYEKDIKILNAKIQNLRAVLATKRAALRALIEEKKRRQEA